MSKVLETIIANRLHDHISMIYNLHLNDFTQMKRLFLKYITNWIIENVPRLPCWIFLLCLIHLIMIFLCNAYTGILGFLAQLFCGLVRICQTDTKELTYLVHARAPNIFHLEFHTDQSLVLFFFPYTVHYLVESLLRAT